ncbi:MAG: DNA-processing protein DprA [Acidobacteria bacterium]|nr:DNA-processing protein DprA [Acidobacteriota bacterium]
MPEKPRSPSKQDTLGLTRSAVVTYADRSRACLALALRELKWRPRGVVDALGAARLPNDGREFADYWHADRLGLDGTDPAGAWERAERNLERCDDLAITVIAYGDPRYPTRLAALQGPERRGAALGGYVPLLYCRGSAAGLNDCRSVAVIGTRTPSAFGRRRARAFGHDLAAEGFVVVSGLARGCDTEAHWGCIDAAGITVAVLAHGVDSIYPPENADLADRLIGAGGCLVSEYPPGTPPRRRAFGQRDRIQSALAELVVVVETPGDDGTMITVDYARKQGRPVGCLVHPPRHAGVAAATGNSRLLSGYPRAIPLRMPGDALAALRARSDTV